MTRRRLLRALSAVFGLLVGLPAAASTAPPPPVGERLRGLLRAPESAAAVGRAYLAQHPEERSANLLARHLCATLPDTCDDATLRAALHGRIRDDFAREEVVEVAGWMLSRTEARLAALAAL